MEVEVSLAVAQEQGQLSLLREGDGEEIQVPHVLPSCDESVVCVLVKVFVTQCLSVCVCMCLCMCVCVGCNYHIYSWQIARKRERFDGSPTQEAYIVSGDKAWEGMVM